MRRLFLSFVDGEQAEDGDSDGEDEGNGPGQVREESVEVFHWCLRAHGYRYGVRVVVAPEQQGSGCQPRALGSRDSS